MVEKHRKRRLLEYENLPLSQNRMTSIPLAFRQEPTELAPRTSQFQPGATDVAQPYLIHWLRSGKNLDFCLMAVCSCVLTLLCHQAVVSLSSPSAVSSPSGLTSAPIANLSRIDLAIKAGLFTTSQTGSQTEEAE